MDLEFHFEKQGCRPIIYNDLRCRIIKWIIEFNDEDENPYVIQTTLLYFDCIFSKRSYNGPLVMTVVACTYIGQQLHGSALQAESLLKGAYSTYGSEHFRLLVYTIMEKAHFTSIPITPQSFISHLANVCGLGDSDQVELAATFICMTSSMVNKNLCKEYPSVLAAAALQNAVSLLAKQTSLDLLKTNEVFRTASAKTINLDQICETQRKAILEYISPQYKHTWVLRSHGRPPHYIAQRIIYEIGLVESQN